MSSTQGFNIEENYRLLNKNTGINKLRIEIDKDGIKVNEVEEKKLRGRNELRKTGLFSNRGIDRSVCDFLCWLW